MNKARTWLEIIDAFRVGLEEAPLRLEAQVKKDATFNVNILPFDLCLDGDAHKVRLSHLAWPEELLEMPLGDKDTATRSGRFIGKLTLLLNTMPNAALHGVEPDPSVLQATGVKVTATVAPLGFVHPAIQTRQRVPTVSIQMTGKNLPRLWTDRGELIIGNTAFPERTQEPPDAVCNLPFACLALSMAHHIDAEGMDANRIQTIMYHLESKFHRPMLATLRQDDATRLIFSQSIMMDAGIIVAFETKLTPSHTVRGSVWPGSVPTSTMIVDVRKFEDAQAVIGRCLWLADQADPDGGMVLQ